MKTYRTISEVWRLAHHYRGKIIARSPIARMVIATYLCKVQLVRLVNLRTELQSYSSYQR